MFPTRPILLFSFLSFEDLWNGVVGEDGCEVIIVVRRLENDNW
jgi:hypothetical protein